VGDVGIEAATGEQFISPIVKLFIRVSLHQPSDGENPHPGTCGIEALNCVVAIEWVEKQESGLRVVLWGAQGVKENTKQDNGGCPNSPCHLISRPHHGLEVELIDHSLRKENGIVIDHHQYVMQWSIWSLILPKVKSNGA